MKDVLRDEVGRRLCLNLLIQGAASHAWITAHFVAQNELERMRPGLTAVYDRLAVSLQLAQWVGDIVMFTGTASRFWKQLLKKDHPFRMSRFMMTYGHILSRAAEKRTVERAKKKRVVRMPVLHMAQLLGLLHEAWQIERPIRSDLETVAVNGVSEIWAIPADRLRASLAHDTRIANIPVAQTRFGRLASEGAVGWSGVERVDDKLIVQAKAWLWPILVHELVKGTVELICLHGMSRLDDTTYSRVMAVTDQIEHELWMLQSGGELFRLLLSAKPKELPIANCMMHISLLEPEMLEQFLFDLIEDPPAANRTMQMWK